jgi:hypothetical protein
MRCRFAPTPPCRLAWCRLRSARRPKVSPEQACVLHWYWSPRTSPLLSMTPMTMCSGLLSMARVWSPLRLDVPCHGGVACCDTMVSNAGISNVVGTRYLWDENVSQASPTQRLLTFAVAAAAGVHQGVWVSQIHRRLNGIRS